MRKRKRGVVKSEKPASTSKIPTNIDGFPVVAWRPLPEIGQMVLWTAMGVYVMVYGVNVDDGGLLLG